MTKPRLPRAVVVLVVAAVALVAVTAGPKKPVKAVPPVVAAVGQGVAAAALKASRPLLKRTSTSHPLPEDGTSRFGKGCKFRDAHPGAHLLKALTRH